MKTIFLTMASLALLFCLVGCPAGVGNSDGTQPTPTNLTGSKGTVVMNSAGSSSASENTTISEGLFEIAGIRLGITYDAWRGFYPEESGVFLESAWATEGETGFVSAMPEDMEIAPVDSAWFWESQLTGFFSDFSMTQVEYNARIESLEEKFGQSVEEPPAWVLDTPSFAEYQGPPDGVVQHLWCNEDGREVMMSYHVIAEGFSTFSLINVDLLDGRVDEALIAKVGQGSDAGLDSPIGEGGAPGSDHNGNGLTGFDPVPAGEFGFDGVFLGADADLVKSRYESRGSIAMGMWVDRDWTGRIDGNPLGGATYPSEAAWFLDGGLVGFMSTVDGSNSAYVETTNLVAGLYGEPLSIVPDWAKNSDFFTEYNFQGNEEGVAIWVDEANRGMLFATFEPLDNTITTMLVDVDNYREAMETTDEAVGAQGHPQ